MWIINFYKSSIYENWHALCKSLNKYKSQFFFSKKLHFRKIKKIFYLNNYALYLLYYNEIIKTTNLKKNNILHKIS